MFVSNDQKSAIKQLLVNSLLLRFSSFHTNPPNFQNSFGGFGIPGHQGLPDVTPQGGPRFRRPLPSQLDLEEVTNVFFSKHQECVCMVQTNGVSAVKRWIFFKRQLYFLLFKHPF